MKMDLYEGLPLPFNSHLPLLAHQAPNKREDADEPSSETAQWLGLK
jgi:hypothetical protein